MTTALQERLDALSQTAQSAILSFVEFLEWRARLPLCRGETESADRRAMGERLRAVRETLRQTVDEAAYVAGLHATTYEAYERGQIGRWATRKMLAYCETWNVRLDWLVEGTGAMFVDDKPPHIAPRQPVSPSAPVAAPRPRRVAPEPEPALPAGNIIDWETARARKDGAV